MRGQNIYAVCIHDHRAFRFFQHRPDHRQRSLGLPQTGADQHGVHLRKPCKNFRHGIDAEPAARVGQGKNHRLIEFHRFNAVDALRHPQKHQPRA